MKKIILLTVICLIQSAAFAHEFGTAGADSASIRNQQYAEIKQDMQNFRQNQQQAAQQYQYAKTPSIQRNSSNGINNYNFSNATNQYTGTMVQPLK